MDWIAGWNNRIKFEIDHTNIDEDLSNFPVLVNLDATYSGVFTELGNNNKRMAFINPTSGQQYFCEIENWDPINNSAQLWVKIPTVSSGTNTEFYMLYDNNHVDNIDYIGETLATDWSEFGSYTTGSLTGDATIVSDYILLTPAVDGKEGAYFVPSIPRGPEFSVYFKHYAGGGDGADKINFRWGTYGVDYNEISIDEYHDVIRYYFNGEIKQEVACSNIDNSTWSNVKITTHVKNGNTYIKCWFRGILYIDTYITHIESSNNFSFYGRTGGLNNEHRIKDIQLKSHSIAAKNVWDDNFIAVYHMAQDPSSEGNCIIDSTYNSKDAMTQGSMTGTDLVNGKIGQAISFDGVDDYIKVNYGGGYDPGTTGFTAEALFKPVTISGGATRTIISKGNRFSTQEGWGIFQYNSGLTVRCNASDDSTERASQANSVFADDTWEHVALVLDRTVNKILGYGNGDNSGFTPGGLGPTNDDITGFDISTTDSMEIAAVDDAGTAYNLALGDVDEVRLSNIARSPAWLCATYKSNFDNLLIKSSEETLSSGKLDYAHRIKLIIPSDKIDDTLYNFPILINLSDSSGVTNTNVAGIFSQLENDSNRKKIAVTDYTGVAQCYVEIEHWSTVNKSAKLWVKVPEVSSIQDTILYLYYDINHADNSLMVGDTNSVPAQQVWDSNFVFVHHMSQDPTGGTGCILDSTGNANNGTPNGSMTSDDLVDGQIGKALDFDGVDDKIQVIDSPTLRAKQKITLEGWIYSHQSLGSSPYPMIVFKQDYDASTGYLLGQYQTSGNSLGIRIGDGSSLHEIGYSEPNYNEWMYIVGIYDGTYLRIYKNSVQQNSANVGSFTLAHDGQALTLGNSNLYGVLDEIRISNTDRSNAWLKATYYSNIDSLLTFNNLYYFSGYVYERGIPVSRQVYAYYKENGNFISSTTSSGNGYYYLETTYSGAHFLVCTDDLCGIDYKDLIIGNVFPTAISV